MPSGPTGGSAADQARQLLATPVNTDQDVLDRVTAIIGPEAGHSRTRTLWLLFLDAQGTQANLIIPSTASPSVPPSR